MRKLDQEREVLRLAAGLRVNWQQNAVENIVALCQQKIARWLKARPDVQSIEALEKLVCEKVKLVIEEVWSDEGLDNLIRKYVNLLGEPVFTTLVDDLDDTTFAALIERRKIDAASNDRYVAVVDCRGEKATRRFFTRWHEIAHLLTLQGQLELPLHRSTAMKTPTERLMDVIAGEIGFYEPIFNPILAMEVAKQRALTFEAVENIRRQFCPGASFHATLNACVKRLGSAAVVLEVGLGLKKEEQERTDSQQRYLIPMARPEPKFRVLTVAGNQWAAASKLQVHRNMQVPPSSLLYEAFFDRDGMQGSEISGTEDLAIWLHSDGTSLASIRVKVQARRIQSSVIALLLPAG